jgi:hypothetical protein
MGETSVLSVEVEARIDEVCDRFEAEWKAGRPLLESYLGDWQGAARAALLGELLAVELECRRASGEHPTEEEYRHRFPDAPAVLDRIFPARGAASDPGGSTLAVPDGQPDGPADEQQPAIPGYEVLGIVGKGGFGRVHRARQVGLNRVVALKVILLGEHADAAERQRFRREAEVIARLQHPHIVQVYEVGEHAGRPFFAMEYCPGGSLAEQLARSPLEPAPAAALVERLASAMHAAHQKGVVHRDLKPANVLLGSDGKPRITDFGLAKKLDEHGQTRTGAILGTPSYMAPEQAAGKKEVGPAADVYALGAVLYECLTGRPPFKAATSFDTILQVIGDEPVPPRQLNAKVPKDLETICLKCLHKEQARRYASAAELAADLKRWQAGEPILARPVGRAERVVKWVRRRPVIAALSAAVVVALLAGTGVSLSFKWQKDREAAASAQSLAEKEKETRAALEAVEDNLAVGLMRPLGHEAKAGPLNDIELEALEELARLPKERDRVRVLFIRRALEKPGTARQLDRRLEEALIATVGLRQDLRRKAMQEAALRLLEESTPRETKVICARLLAELWCDEEAWAGSAAAFLVDEMSRAASPVLLHELLQSFAALAGRVPAEQTATLAGRLLELAARRTDPYFLLAAQSQVFAALAGRVPAEQAGTLAGRIVELAAKPTNPSFLYVQSQFLAALAGRVPAEQAGTLAGRLLELAARPTDPYFLRAQSHAFAALAGRVPAEQAGTLAGRIVELAAKRTNPYFLFALSRAFAALAGKVPAEQAAKQTATLAGRLLELAARRTDPDYLLDLSESFAALAGWAPAEQTATLAGRLLELAAKPTDDPYSLRTQSQVFAALAGRVPAKQAGTLARRIVELAARRTDRDSLRALSQAFAALAGWAPAEQAGTVAGRIVELAGEVTDLDSLLALSRSFSALAGKVPAEQAGKQAATLTGRIFELAADQRDPDSLLEVSAAFAALADRVSSERVDKQAAMLADRIVKVASMELHPGSLRKLSQAFAALAGRVPSERVGKQAATLARHIGELAARGTDESLPALSLASASLPGKRTKRDTSRLVLRLAALSHRYRNNSEVVGALDRLLPQLGPDVILEALKRPGCVGSARAALIAHLGRRQQRSFRDVWELVDHLKEHAPDLDLDSPLRLPQTTP